MRRYLFRALAVLLFCSGIAPAQEAGKAGLTDAQKRVLQTLEAESTEKAAALFAQLSQAAKQFNSNLLSGKPDPEVDRKLSREMADLFAEMAQLRLARIRSAAKTLTPEQKASLAAALKEKDAPYLFDDLVRKVLGDPKK